ncbi:MAG: nucleotidyltransferase domain-containing protein [Pseudomonadota bacterium]
MLHIEPRHLEIVTKILEKYPHRFYAFGSRVTGENQPLSDLDLCIMEHVPSQVKSQLAEDFEESNLPFKVDLILWAEIDDDFKALIRDDLELVQ